MLLAALDGTGWGIVIGAACVGVGGILTGIATLIIGYFDRRRKDAREDAREQAAIAREDARIERDRIQAEKVEEVKLRQAEAAKEVKSVKTTLEKSNDATTVKLDGIAEVGLRTEKYCNSALGRALRLVAGTARAKADITKDPVDIAAASLAERESQDHENEQKKMDAAQKPPQKPATDATLGELKKDIAELSQKTGEVPETTANLTTAKVVKELKDEGKKP